MSPKSTYISLVNKSTLSSLTQTFLGFISGVSHHFPTITPDVDVLSSVAKLVSDKSIRAFIGHSYALCDVKKAHEYVEKGDSVGKVILDVIDAFTPKVEIQIESTNENDLPVERESLPKRKSKDMTRDSTTSSTKDQQFHDLLYEEEESKPKLNEETKVEELKEEEEVTATESNPFEETHETSNPFEENSIIESVPKEEEQEVAPGFSDVNI
jgi:DNA polymerase sigma